ncbi:hypothetical protein [Aurantiacibacter poecillastricola]|uniref:hypothetical protein n=1 Tax=Aurantiacibacter poecillastricola TaxID=3064385 RepID=UPI00273F9CDA|nr:hypothetical protein [Aurantiacibacter sp. 219JJ12-13]MDP5261064.1 hypothetical protein [Aurantiacibacter sp. 219JJ12-13]
MRFTSLAAVSGLALALAACGDAAEDTDVVEADSTITDTMDSDVAGSAMADADMGGETVTDASTATAAELETAGASPELAAAIVAAQPFADATELQAVMLEYVSEDEAEDIRRDIFVPIDLNSASNDAIALIPGMSDRMIGEFLEYRPYENMDEFNREIGKYVDEAEVARLRRYVTL